MLDFLSYFVLNYVLLRRKSLLNRDFEKIFFRPRNIQRWSITERYARNADLPWRFRTRNHTCRTFSNSWTFSKFLHQTFNYRIWGPLRKIFHLFYVPLYFPSSNREIQNRRKAIVYYDQTLGSGVNCKGKNDLSGW